ncbi:hypothetical protein F4779DRAFT_619687 [Xylariaceae sp. FL0662B]|nr:hypothetical protein F4779DRAFT_619687 [Xylariaceae sp. FL0662B]
MARQATLTQTRYDSDKNLATARSRLLEACGKIDHLVTGPLGHMVGIAQSHRVHAALQHAFHFNLASEVPEEGTPITYEEQPRSAEYNDAAKSVRLSYMQRRCLVPRIIAMDSVATHSGMLYLR